MNLRNRKLVITLRIIFGLFMVFSGVSGLMMGSSFKGVPADMIPTMQVLLNTGLLYMIKVSELLAGLMLITGILPALAALILAPLSIGIVIVNARTSPANLPMGLFVMVLTIYLGYVYWDKYKAIFSK